MFAQGQATAAFSLLLTSPRQGIQALLLCGKPGGTGPGVKDTLIISIDYLCGFYPTIVKLMGGKMFLGQFFYLNFSSPDIFEPYLSGVIARQ